MNTAVYNPPIFHVGFPKAGSTTLQRQVFARLPGFCYLGMHHYADGPEAGGRADASMYRLLNDFYEAVFKRDGFNFDEDRARTLLTEVVGRTGGERALFSHEAGLATLFSHPDAADKAERLKRLFDRELKVVIVVREQTAILASQYRDHPFDPNNPLVGRPVEFEEWVRGMEQLRYFRYTDLLHYDRLASLYDRLFGEENVLVLPLEMTKTHPSEFAARFAAFSGTLPNQVESLLGNAPMNEGHSARWNKVRRLQRQLPQGMRIGRLIPPFARDAAVGLLNGGPKDKVHMSDGIVEHIRSAYASSNARLGERIGFDLGAIGYAVSDNTESAQCEIALGA